MDRKTYHVYAIIGDGELQEGSVWESFMAGHKYSLDNMTVILDRNRVQLDGFTNDIMPQNNIREMVSSFGWEVIEIDGHNYEEIIGAVEKAKNFKGKPTFILANTVKGKGVSYMENNPKYHGSPPANDDEYERALRELSGDVP